MLTLGGGDEASRLRRVVNIDRRRERPGDLGQGVDGAGNGDVEAHAVQENRPVLAAGRGPAQRDDGRRRHDVAEGRRLRLEGSREAARGALDEDDLGTFGDRGHVVAEAGRNTQRQRGRDVPDGFADAHGMGHRPRLAKRFAFVEEADGPGGTDHGRALQRQQGNARRAVEAGLVGIDHEQVGQREAMAGAVGHHQRRAVAHGGVVRRRQGVDAPGERGGSRGGGFGNGFRNAAVGPDGVGDDAGQAVADQGHGKGLADDQRLRQGCDARDRHDADLQSRRRRDGEVGLAIDDDELGALIRRDVGRISGGVDRGGEFCGDDLERFDRVGVGDAAHGHGPDFAESRAAKGSAQGQAGDGRRGDRTGEAAGRACRLLHARTGREAGLARILDHQRVAIDAGGETGAGGVDLRRQAGRHLGQGDRGADRVIVGAGGDHAAVVEAERDRPGVARHRRAGDLHAPGVGRDRIRRQRRRFRADGEAGFDRVARGIDDDQRHA